MKKRIIKTIAILVIFCALILAAAGIALQNLRIKLFVNTLWFSIFTLNDPAYIAYDVDLMELFRDYCNNDTKIDGAAHIDHVEGVGFSMKMDIDAQRCYAQKRMAGKADLSVLSLSVGDFDFYAEDEMTYFIAPMLENLSYAFDTDLDLFFRAPELTSDIDQEWFQAHMDDIRQLMGEISIDETGEVISDGGIFGKSKGYHVVIPEGSGGFIWELLGMDAPDHDIAVDMFLDSFGRLRRLVVDIPAEDEGATILDTVVTIDGLDCGTLIADMSLVDGERTVITAVRNGEFTFTHYLDISGTYYVNNGDEYSASGVLTWDYVDGGATLRASDIVVLKNEETVGEALFEGEIKKTRITGDVFADTVMDLSSIEIYEWKELKNDIDGFLEDVKDKVMERI